MSIFRRMIYNAIQRFSPQSEAYWIQRLFGSEPSITGIEVNEDNAMKYSAVWSAVNIISGAVGFLPLIVYRRTEGGSRQRAINHPLYPLLHSRSNQYMSAQVFKETLTAHALIWGNGYAEIQREQKTGRPIALWPLLPNQTRCIYDNERDVYVYEITNYDGKGGSAYLDYDNVLHIHGLGFDGSKGYSVIRYAADSLGIGLAAERNAGTFFKNDSSPPGVLSTDIPLNKETKEQIEKSWEEKHGGLDNRYRIAVLHSGLKYQAFGIPAKDAQLLESRKFGIAEVARWFQIPPHMIGDLDRATFSNIEHQGIQFVTMTLQRWLEYWKHEIDYKLFTTSDRRNFFADFVVDMLLRGDSETRAKVYQIALGGNNNPGYMTINEVRQRENLPAIDSGNQLFFPNYGGTNQDREGGNEGYKDLFVGAWNRILTKEVKAVRKASKRPETFDDWVDNFYDEHVGYMQGLLNPILRVYYGKEPPMFDITDYIESRKRDVKKAHKDGTLDTFLCEIEAIEASRQTQKTMNLIEDKNNEQNAVN